MQCCDKKEKEKEEEGEQLSLSKVSGEGIVTGISSRK